MEYKKIFAHSFKNKETSTQTTVAIIAGVTIGIAIGALFATKKGHEMRGKLAGFVRNLADQLTGNTEIKAKEKLGSLIGDVRVHIKQNADGLLDNGYVMKDKLLVD